MNNTNIKNKLNYFTVLAASGCFQPILANHDFLFKKILETITCALSSSKPHTVFEYRFNTQFNSPLVFYHNEKMNFFFDLFRAADLLQHDGIDGIQAVKKRASKQMPIFQSLNMFASFHSGGSPKLREEKIL